MRDLFGLILTGLLLTSCSSLKVVSNVFHRYPVCAEPEEVVVYERENEVPGNSTTVGLVRVYDDGTAKPVPWETTLGMAKRVVSKKGGNGLLIQEHTYPDSLSFNHQLSGMMLRSMLHHNLHDQQKGLISRDGHHIYAGVSLGV